MVKNRHLSKSISDAGWGIFFSMLKYKSEWYGNNILQIGRFDASSKICSCCGYYNKYLTLKDRTFVCPSCSTVIDRDINASINIKKFALNKITIGQDLSEFTPVENDALALSLNQEAHCL
jgi:putative transposase